MTDGAASAGRRTDVAGDATTPDNVGPAINVGVVVAYTPGTETEPLRRFAHRAVEDAETELEAATGVPWQFHVEAPFRLSNDETRRPSDFLDEASLRMVEGPYDLVVVVTNAALTSRRRKAVPGLASEVSRIAVVSARRLTRTSRGRPPRDLSDEAVRWNAATLVVHLLGHVLGVDHADGVMAPFRFDESRRESRRSASRRPRACDDERIDCPDRRRWSAEPSSGSRSTSGPRSAILGRCCCHSPGIARRCCPCRSRNSPLQRSRRRSC
jgi:predicted Zn-dependent protease